MNENEAAQYARDTRTADRAIKDAKTGEFKSPVGMNPIPSDRTIHDDKVYKAACRETWEHK